MESLVYHYQPSSENTACMQITKILLTIYLPTLNIHFTYSCVMCVCLQFTLYILFHYSLLTINLDVFSRWHRIFNSSIIGLIASYVNWIFICFLSGLVVLFAGYFLSQYFLMWLFCIVLYFYFGMMWILYLRR